MIGATLWVLSSKHNEPNSSPDVIPAKRRELHAQMHFADYSLHKVELLNREEKEQVEGECSHLASGTQSAASPNDTR